MSDNLLYYGDPGAPGLFAERDGTRAAAPLVVRALARSAASDGLKPALRTEPDTWRCDRAGAEAFHEVVESGGRVAQPMIAFRTFLGENPGAPGLAYLANMAPRRVELRRVLKPIRRRSSRSGATLSEMLVTMWSLTMGMIVASWAGRRFGCSGYPLGFIGGVLVIIIVILLYCRLLDLYDFVWRGGHTFPVCRGGNCESGDYELTFCCMRLSPRRPDEGAFLWLCRCGGLYERRNGRFMEVLGDGMLEPYLVWHPFRGWYPDYQQDHRESL